MLRTLFMVGALLATGVGLAVAHGTENMVAQAGPTPCQFAGYGPGGGLINTTITCVTPSAGAQATPTGGNCIAVSTPPAAGSIAYTCPTPYPTPATPTPYPSPVASTGCSITYGPETVGCTGYGVKGVATPFPIASVGTGTVSNTYQTLVTTTVVLPASFGPTGAWYGVVELDLSTALNTSGNPNVGCITTASTVVTQSYTAGGGTSTPCNSSPTGAIAGDYGFGTQPTSYVDTTVQYVKQTSRSVWTGTAAGSQTLTFVGKVANLGTTSIIIYGSMPSWWIPI